MTREEGDAVRDDSAVTSIAGMMTDPGSPTPTDASSGVGSTVGAGVDPDVDPVRSTAIGSAELQPTARSRTVTTAARRREIDVYISGPC